LLVGDFFKETDGFKPVTNRHEGEPAYCQSGCTTICFGLLRSLGPPRPRLRGRCAQSLVGACFATPRSKPLALPEKS
jgi:hypothetical protein